MIQKPLTFLTAVVLLASAAQAGTINPRPYTGVGKNAFEDSLQTVLNKQGYGVDVKNGQSKLGSFDAPKSATFTILAEVAGYANLNTFGIYSSSNPSHKFTIFNGPDGAGKSTTIAFKGDDLYANGKLVCKDFGDDIGFFLKTPENNTFYSEDKRNLDKGAQALIFEGSSKTKGLSKSSLLVAFEDLRLKSSDRDFQDMVVRVDSRCVPEPSSIALALLGAGAIAARRRKKVEPTTI